MYRLRDLKNGKYQLHSKNDGAFEGTLNSIMLLAIDWGLEYRDVHYAVNCLKRNDHDYAEFGVLGGFLYTCCDEDKKVG